MKNALAALTILSIAGLPALAKESPALKQLLAASGKDLPVVAAAQGSEKAPKETKGGGKHPCSASLDTGIMIARAGKAPTPAEVTEVVRRACAGVGKCRKDGSFSEFEGETLGRLGLAGKSDPGTLFFNTLQHTIEGHDQNHRASRPASKTGDWWSQREWDPEVTLGQLASNLSIQR